MGFVEGVLSLTLFTSLHVVCSLWGVLGVVSCFVVVCVVCSFVLLYVCKQRHIMTQRNKQKYTDKNHDKINTQKLHNLNKVLKVVGCFEGFIICRYLLYVTYFSLFHICRCCLCRYVTYFVCVIMFGNI